ncbi:glycosyltransferase involved in cell wall biosynthesis [Salinibacter ruber]|uniref:glycosyltransferase family 2 protein n=1 Tax=Salinibacter ruber TaxID=146919 RepID=UPI00216A859D|nr:glycosyltransferase family 2 protein [Salinibacter ruber]MCS3657967.1 glycosyltransferase involved in cell wall biosynthesis [Salinibacter ruber]MCS4169876.1 glycosyltransferase involved in cell wall biosynthesis [Salinibacter ruber]
MRCPTLDQLPDPPPGKTGWPWTEQSEPVLERQLDGTSWPKISIVTPSYNQGQFIEETIRSVLLQGYPNLEYIVIDGGSSDESTEIIQKYDEWIEYWVSEPDDGQSNAINKGLEQCSGEIFNWLNSDDLLTMGALTDVADLMKNHHAVAGACVFFGNQNEEVRTSRGLNLHGLIYDPASTAAQQPAIWVRTEHVRSCGGVDGNMQYAFDHDLYRRYFYSYSKVNYTSSPLARFRLHDESKSCAQADRFDPEQIQSLKKLRSDPTYEDFHRDCDYRIRQIQWHLRVANARANSSASGIWRAILLLCSSFMDPGVRWSRFTFGAIRELVTDSLRLA